MGKGQRKRTERRAEQEGGGAEAPPVVDAPEAPATEDEEPEFTTVGRGLHISDPEGAFEASSESIAAAQEFGDNALDLLAEGDRVQSSAEMQYAHLQAQLALVNAVRDIGISLRVMDYRLSDLEHQLRFRQDPPQPHTHQLHLS